MGASAWNRGDEDARKVFCTVGAGGRLWLDRRRRRRSGRELRRGLDDFGDGQRVIDGKRFIVHGERRVFDGKRRIVDELGPGNE